MAGTPVPEVADRLIRRVVRSGVLALAVLTGLWTTALVVFGGIDTEILGTRITSHDPRRTLLYTSLLLSVFILAGGTFRPWRSIRHLRLRFTTPAAWRTARVVPLGAHVPAAVAMIAACLLVRQWATGQTMWLDEEMIALNVRDRALADLPGLLWLGQTAPLGWLVLQRVMLVTFGAGEMALRFVPLLFGIATLTTSVWIGRRWLTPVGATILTLLCASGYWFAYHSVELKQYSSDAFWALLLPALAAGAIRPESASPQTRLRRIDTWWVTAAVGHWFAVGALLVTPGCGLALVATVLRRDGSRAAVKAALPGIVWLISFALHYHLSLRQAASSDYLRGYWSPGMLPASAGLMDAVGWLAGRLESLAMIPGGAERWDLFWLAAAAGLALSWKRSGLGAFFGAVVLSGFVWALCRLVPMSERVSLWMMPALYVGIALCVDSATRMARRAYAASQWPALGGAALIGVVGLNATIDVFRGAHLLLEGRPASNHELDDRTAVRWLMTERLPGDALLSTHFGLPALWWYGAISIGPPLRGSQLPDGGPVYELSHVRSPCRAEQFHEALKDHQRVLVYLGFRFDDVPRGFDDLVRVRLQELGGSSVYREFAGRSRVLILDRRPEARASDRPEATVPAAPPRLLDGCLQVQPARRRSSW